MTLEAQRRPRGTRTAPVRVDDADGTGARARPGGAQESHFHPGPPRRPNPQTPLATPRLLANLWQESSARAESRRNRLRHHEESATCKAARQGFLAARTLASDCQAVVRRSL